MAASEPWRVCANYAVTNADPCEDGCPCDNLSTLFVPLEPG